VNGSKEARPTFSRSDRRGNQEKGSRSPTSERASTLEELSLEPADRRLEDTADDLLAAPVARPLSRAPFSSGT